MKNPKLFLIFLAILVPSFTLGQQRLSSEDAARSWAVVDAHLRQGATGTAASAASQAAIVVEVQPNSQEVEVWLSLRMTGRYLVQGRSCGRGAESLGEIWVNEKNQETLEIPILLSQLSSRGRPYAYGICDVDLFREENGLITQLSTSLSEGIYDIGFEVVNNGPTGTGEYFILVSGTLEKDAVAVLGRDRFASRLEPVPGGFLIFFSGGPRNRSTTLTICELGRCVTRSFRARDGVPTGKG